MPQSPQVTQTETAEAVTFRLVSAALWDGGHKTLLAEFQERFARYIEASRQSPQPPEDAVERGWISHPGMKLPNGLRPDTLVEVKFRDGSLGEARKASEIFWGKMDEEDELTDWDDVVAYRPARAAIAAITPSPSKSARELLADVIEADDCTLSAKLLRDGKQITVESPLAIRAIERALAPSQGVIEALTDVLGLFDQSGALFCSGEYQLEVIAKARALLASTAAADQDLGKIERGHACKHGVRWPYACQPCDDAAWEQRPAADQAGGE